METAATSATTPDLSFPDGEYSNYERDVLPLLKNDNNDNALANAVDNIIETRYSTVDVAKAIKDLESVGEVLSIAFAASKGFKCNVAVVTLLTSYQGLTRDSSFVCTQFVLACMQALDYYALALQLVGEKQVEEALEILKETGAEAAKMAMLASELVVKSGNLCDLGGKALSDAAMDESASQKKKHDIAEMLARFKASKERHESQTARLTKAIEEAKEEERAAVKKADEERQQEHELKLISIVMAPVTAVASSFSGLVNQPVAARVTPTNSTQAAPPSSEIVDTKAKLEKAEGDHALEKDEAKQKKLAEEITHLQRELAILKNQHNIATIPASATAAEREARIANNRMELQRQEREEAASLAESLSRLASAQDQDNELEQAVESLGMAVKQLGKIQTVFQNVQAFWKGVQSHCDSLSNTKIMNTLKTPKLAPRLFKEITKAGISWMALGKLNYSAMVQTKSAATLVDSVMTDLPTVMEAKARVQKMIKEKQKQLAQFDEQAAAS